MKPDLAVDLCGISMANPVVTVSGTCGNGRELAQFYDLGVLGAFTVKSIRLEKHPGNPLPRIAESASGVLNSIGIPSEGVRHFIEYDLPFLRQYRVPVIASIAATRAEDYARIASILDGEQGISAIEVNVSCPNLETGGCAFGSDPEVTGQIIHGVKESTRFPVIAKLTPNVTDIALIARSVEKAGADAVSLINTLAAMSIDIETRRPKLGNVTGGLSGPAIKPVALRMVYQAARAVKIPIIGIGGIAGPDDALEFIIAGALAVQVGTANFYDPGTSPRIVDGIRDYCRRKRLHLADLVGSLRTS